MFVRDYLVDSSSSSNHIRWSSLPDDSIDDDESDREDFDEIVDKAKRHNYSNMPIRELIDTISMFIQHAKEGIYSDSYCNKEILRCCFAQAQTYTKYKGRLIDLAITYIKYCPTTYIPLPIDVCNMYMWTFNNVGSSAAAKLLNKYKAHLYVPCEGYSNDYARALYTMYFAGIDIDYQLLVKTYNVNNSNNILLLAVTILTRDISDIHTAESLHRIYKHTKDHGRKSKVYMLMLYSHYNLDVYIKVLTKEVVGDLFDHLSNYITHCDETSKRLYKVLRCCMRRKIKLPAECVKYVSTIAEILYAPENSGYVKAKDEFNKLNNI